MANKSDDDYWFSSTTKAFDFGDEASLSFQKSLTSTNTHKTSTPSKQSVYGEESELTDEFQKTDIPIRSVISQQCLNKLLQDNTSNVSKPLSEKLILETVDNILLNLPYILENFKDLQSKVRLLDTAIDTADGNAILMVVLFLANTLKKDVLYKLLSVRRIALLHYIHYLSIRVNTKELTNLLIITGYSTTVWIKLFKILVQNSVNDVEFKKKLEQLLTSNFSKFATEKDNQILKFYVDLLAWQQNVQKYENMKNILGQSVNKSLATCCQFYWDKAADHTCSTQYLSRLQAISERQLHWIYLDVKSSSQSWDEIQKMFIKNRWFGTRKVITSSLSAENMVVLLGERKAPSAVLESFLPMVEDPGQALNLALRYRCHDYVITYYYTHKNRTALIAYKSKLSSQSEHYYKLEDMLVTMGNN